MSLIPKMVPRVKRPCRASAIFAASVLALLLARPCDLLAQSPGDSASIERLEQRVRVLRDRGAPAELGAAWLELAEAYHVAERRGEVIAAARAAIPLLAGAGREAELARAHNRLGLNQWHLSEYDSAVVHLNTALGLWKEQGDVASLGRNYSTLGSAHYQAGNFEVALDAFLRALHYRRIVGDTAGEARVRTNIGLIHHELGLYERARAELEEAVRVADRSGSTFDQGYSRQELARLHLALEEWDRAEVVFREALRRFGPGDWPNTVLGLAMIEVGRGNPADAIPRLTSVLEVAEAGTSRRQEIRALLHLGQAHRAVGDHAAAVRVLEEGLEVARRWDQRPLALSVLAELADVHEARGDAGRALASLRAETALRDSILSTGAAQRVEAVEGRLESERGEEENQRLRQEQRVREAIISRQRVIVLLAGALLVISLLLVGFLFHFNGKGRERAALLVRSNSRLNRALAEVQSLKGLIPICANCKRMRDDEGYWETVEKYISDRSAALFSHSICSTCGPRLYGADWTGAPTAYDRVDRSEAPEPG